MSFFLAVVKTLKKYKTNIMSFHSYMKKAHFFRSLMNQNIISHPDSFLRKYITMSNVVQIMTYHFMKPVFIKWTNFSPYTQDRKKFSKKFFFAWIHKFWCWFQNYRLKWNPSQKLHNTAGQIQMTGQFLWIFGWNDFPKYVKKTDFCKIFITTRDRYFWNFFVGFHFNLVVCYIFHYYKCCRNFGGISGFNHLNRLV